MSSGQKACADDEDDWYDIKKSQGITEVSWGVYSSQATITKKLVRADPLLKGVMLKLLVNHEVELKELQARQYVERVELEKALALLKKLS